MRSTRSQEDAPSSCPVCEVSCDTLQHFPPPTTYYFTKSLSLYASSSQVAAQGNAHNLLVALGPWMLHTSAATVPASATPPMLQ